MPETWARKFFTNFYSVAEKNQKMIIHQYAITTEPEIPADSTSLLFNVVKFLKKDDKAKIGYLSCKGNIIYGLKKLDGAELKCQSKFRYNDVQHEFEVTLFKTKEFSPAQLRETENGQQIWLQFLNISLKTMLRNQKMI